MRGRERQELLEPRPFLRGPTQHRVEFTSGTDSAHHKLKEKKDV